MRVLLAMPRYDSRTHMAAAQAFYHPTSPEYSAIEVRAISPGTSLLTGCFNACWASARNEWEAGNADGFAMIHSDVAPAIHWLDVLHQEMEASGADIIGVTMPIKDARGLHSTAVETGNHFRVRRLTSREIADLPETFTDHDVPGLLLNTGLWLCKLGPWCLEAMFHIEDCIVRNAAGRWAAGTVPEDWHFSRQCRKLGLKIACTRKVRAEHYGEQKWNNWGVGGWNTDIQNDPVLTNWRFPEDVRGWLSESEGRQLALLANRKRVLEIGSFCGLSTICMAQTAEVVHAVDPFDGRAATPEETLTEEDFHNNVKKYGVQNFVVAHVGTSAEVIPTLEGKFDLGFIDGAHDEPSVLQDAELALKVLSPGGLLAFHDYRTYAGEADGGWDPGVTSAVNRLLHSGAELISRTDSLAVIQPA